jgi:protein associated with RNAse G/E
VPDGNLFRIWIVTRVLKNSDQACLFALYYFFIVISMMLNLMIF